MVIYVFLDENDCPYYVGQTSNFKERKQAHERYINNKYHIDDRRHNCYKYKKARKLKREGHPFEMFIIDTAKDRKEASSLESYYIKKFRSLGITLCNLTDGGDVPPSRKGAKLSKESRQRISNSKSGKNHPFYGKKFSTKHRNNISKGKTGTKFSDAHKKNLSIARQKRKITYKTRLKTSKTSTGRINIKTYKLIDKGGNEYITTYGLAHFCREHNIPHCSLYRVLNGTKKDWKGWTISRI